MRCLRALMLLSALGAGCAAAPIGPPPPPAEASFRGVRSVALLRRTDPEDVAPGQAVGRRRDPLDALQGALEARGVKTMTLDLPARAPPGLAAVQEALLRAEGAALAASPDAGESQVGTIGGAAAAALDPLGTEVFALYVRGPAWSSPHDFGRPYGLAPPPAQGSAIAVVARDGTVVTFTWGGRAPYGAGPVNAAEAVDAVLNLLLPPPLE